MEERKEEIKKEEEEKEGAGRDKPWAIFASARKTKYEDPDDSATSADVNSVSIGADVLLSPNRAAGGFLTFERNDAEKSNGSTEDIDEYGIAAFYIWFEDKFDATLAGRYGTLDIQNKRATTAGDFAEGSPDGSVWDLSTSFNYYFRVPDETPYPGVTGVARLKYADVTRDGYTETGSSRNLRFDSATFKSLQSSIGIQLFKAYSASFGVLVPTATVTWEHEYEDETTIRAVGEDGIESSVTPLGIDRNWGKADLGLQFIGRNGWSGLFNVDFDFSREDVDRLSYGIFIRKEIGPK